jgi:hypothetical protein
MIAMRLRRPPQLSTDAVDDKVAALVGLAYELLDAHADTAQLATDDAPGTEWDTHLAYLRDLQRAGRGVLARAAPPSGR